MGKMLADLLHLQKIERRLTDVRKRLQRRKNAVSIQQKRIDQLQEELSVLRAKALERRKHADGLELDLKTREAQAARLRTALNTAKTNKEYAAILTQLNSLKADNAKLEEEILRIMQHVDAVQAEADAVVQNVRAEQQRLEEVTKTSAAEVDRLSAILAEQEQQRRAAAESIPPHVLAVFNRIAANYDGEAMAPIQRRGTKPPYTFTCGGCYMTLNAEHANALAVRDEIRTCDICGRVLFLQDLEDEEG